MARRSWFVVPDDGRSCGFGFVPEGEVIVFQDDKSSRNRKPSVVRRPSVSSRPDRSSTGNGGARF